MSASISIRQRVIKYLEHKGVSKYRFYKDTGFSNGFLDKYGSITSDNCEKICYVYPDLNPEWLLTGRGDMLRPQWGIDYVSQLKTQTKDDLIDQVKVLMAENRVLKNQVMELLSKVAEYEPIMDVAADSDKE